MNRGRLWTVVLFVMFICIIGNHTQSYAIAPGTGDVQLQSPPGVRVYIDGFLMGTTNEEDTGLIIQDIPAGPHTIHFENIYGTTRTARFSINAGEIKIFDANYFDSQPIPEQVCPPIIEQLDILVGGLQIRSLPVDCMVTIPSLGISEYKTNKILYINNVPIGRHCITFSGNEQEITSEVEVRERETTYVLGNLADKHIYQELEAGVYNQLQNMPGGLKQVLDCSRRPNDLDEVVVCETSAGLVQIKMRRDWDSESVDWFVDRVSKGLCDEIAWYPVRNCMQPAANVPSDKEEGAVGWERVISGLVEPPVYVGQAGFLARVWSYEINDHRVVMYEASDISVLQKLDIRCFAEVLPIIDTAEGTACRPPSTRNNPISLRSVTPVNNQFPSEICIKRSYIRKESRPAEWLKSEVAGFYSYADPWGSQGKVCVADNDSCTPIEYPIQNSAAYKFTSADGTTNSASDPNSNGESVPIVPVTPGAGFREQVNEFIWQEAKVVDGIEYIFTCKFVDSMYVLELQVTNNTDKPVVFNHDTEARFDFSVEHIDINGTDTESRYFWNYNHNRDFIESPFSVQLAPGETRPYRSKPWNGLSNGGQPPISGQKYLCRAIHLLSGSPVEIAVVATKNGEAMVKRMSH